jgi:hypothetical protein
MRPYNLACRLIHPLRVKTPLDMVSDALLGDGIEFGACGRAVAIICVPRSPALL